MTAHTTPRAHEEHGELVFGTTFGSLRVLLDREVAIIGRSGDCAIQLPHPDVSRRHAELRRLGAAFYQLSDLASRRGTFVNGAPVVGTTVLRLGDTIRFGEHLSARLLLHDKTHEQILRRKRLLTIGRLRAAISNELRNMAAVVVASCEYLDAARDSRVDDPRHQEAMTDIHEAATRASRLLGQVMDFAMGRGRRGVIEVSEVCVDVAELVSRILADGVQVESQIAEDLQCLGHELDLRLALIHLAVDARGTLGNQGSLHISARRDIGEAVVRVTVSSRSADASAKDEAAGPRDGAALNQMCLADAGEIIAAMGGSLSHDSHETGSTAAITLPLLQTAFRHSTQPLSSIPDDRPVSPLNVLVVDDEPVLRRGTCRSLQRAGHHAHEAATSEQALAANRSEHPDVVVLDVHLGGEDGVQVLEALLRDDPDTAVLMVSGALSPTLERELLALGAVDCLVKPWSPKQLLNAIQLASRRR